MRIHNDRRNKKAIEKGGTWGENHPKLAKQWHPTLNGDITPYDITPNCCKKYFFYAPMDIPTKLRQENALSVMQDVLFVISIDANHSRNKQLAFI